jgi:periplasmic divalent cation tolerance protein
MPRETLLILCNCPDRQAALLIAGHLVENGLAACVNLLPEVTSLYRWQGGLEQAQEVTLLIKSTRPRYEELEQAIVSLHPYELPEIIAVPVERGLPGYLKWVEECTASHC